MRKMTMRERMLAVLQGRGTPAPDPAARGVLFGLTPSHTAVHIYRALLESFGYAVRRGFDPIRPRVRRVIVTAGARPARSGGRSCPISWRPPSSITPLHPARWGSRF